MIITLISFAFNPLFILFFSYRVTKDLDELLEGGDVNVDRYLEFARTHHSLLFPAFQLQTLLQKKIIGLAFWTHHSNKRIKLSNNKYMKIKDLLDVRNSNNIY